MIREINRSDLKAEGKVIVGEWGNGTADSSGHIICRAEDHAAVLAAYDAIEDGDSSPDVLDGVYAAGGEHVVGM